MELERAFRAALAIAAVTVSSIAVGAAELHIVNAADRAIVELYVASANAAAWGANRMADTGQRSIAPGASVRLADLDPATYDIRLVDADNGECELTNVEILTRTDLELTSTTLEECRPSN